MSADGAGQTLAENIRRHQRALDVALGLGTVGLALLLVAIAPDSDGITTADLAVAPFAFLAVVYRRHHPGILLALSLGVALFGSMASDRPSPAVFAAIVLLYQVCLGRTRRDAIVIGIATAVVLYVIALLSGDAGAADERALVVIPWCAAAVGIADSVRSRRALIAASEERLAAAVAAADAEANTRLANERLMIAREVHDVLAHHLAVMNVQTAAAAHTLRTDPDTAEESLALARNAGRRLLDELRDVLAVLRSPEVQPAPTSTTPTFDLVDDLVETARAGGLHVDYRTTGSHRPLATQASLTAYRVVQEALTNAAKHGDGAAELVVEFTDRSLTISATNSLGDRDRLDGGHGLVGITERVHLVGGDVEAGIVDDRFELTARLPVLVDAPS